MIELACSIGLPIIVDETKIDNVCKDAVGKGNRVLAIVTATKPCFYKLASLMNEAGSKGLPFFVLHSGQHYDDAVGFGFQEFNFQKHLGADLRIRGDLSQKAAELYLKARVLSSYLKKNHPNILVVPYVNGDTITAAHFPGAWLFATNRSCIQGEAGLRSMTPKKFSGLNAKVSAQELLEMQWNNDWTLNRTEPFPEQYDTFVGAAACEYFFAPVKQNARSLVAEGYDKTKIFTVGNTIVDTIKSLKNKKPDGSVFDLYPKLAEGQWIRVDIHRRENLNERRFKAIIGAVISLVENGEKVAFVELNATNRALVQYSLREKLVELSKKENFLFTPIWQEYAHVIEFLSSDSCKAILTDSGSMQEEMNELGKPCLTARFSSDRSETVMVKSNLLIPPLDRSQMTNSILFAINDDSVLKSMRKARKLYGKDVAKTIVGKLDGLFKDEDQFFSWAHDRLGIYREKNFLEYL